MIASITDWRIDGVNNMNTNQALSESSLLIEIEKLVQTIANDDAGVQYAYIHQQLSNNLMLYTSIYQAGYDYSECLEVFRYACSQLGIFRAEIPLDDKLIRSLVSCIYSCSKLPSMTRRVLDRRYQIKLNAKSIEKYASLLHEKYARLLVVRIDFGYREDNQHLITIEKHYQFLEALNKERYKNPLFEHLVGHAWSVEQGETKGYHIHAVYYFKGSEHQNDWYKAKQIGELWQHLTNKLGTYHSCNTPQEKEKYQKNDKLGVGMIHRSDSLAVANSINAAKYLADTAKENQYLRMIPNRRRILGRGEVLQRDKK